MGKNGNSDRFSSIGLQNHCNSDRSHEIKRPLLLGRKAMTNLDSLLESRDISLLTKVCIVKGIVFLIVMVDVRAGPQRRLSAELMLFNCGFGEDS